MPKDQIRVKSICLIMNDKKELLVSGDYDNVKKSMFYVPLGGHVEFNELSIDAVQRELKEEIDAELENVTLVTVLENFFEWNGKSGHEINFVYKADLVNKEYYNKKEILFRDPHYPNAKVIWLKMKDCIIGKYLFYPEGLREVLKDLSRLQ